MSEQNDSEKPAPNAHDLDWTNEWNGLSKATFLALGVGIAPDLVKREVDAAIERWLVQRPWLELRK